MADVREVWARGTGYWHQQKNQDREVCPINEGERYERRVQRDFATVEFGAGRALKNIFALVSAGVNDEKQLWV